MSNQQQFFKNQASILRTQKARSQENAMGLVSRVEICRLNSVKGGMTEFYTPQSSHETMLVQVPAGTVEDLFVHHFQTDQILVVREVLS